MDLILRLIRDDSHLVVVGDPDQSIYSWRAANIQNILTFPKKFDNSIVIHLDQNYRSSQEILDSANNVIANNGKLDKKLWSDKRNCDMPKMLIFNNDSEEAQHIIKRIKSANLSKVPLKEIAVLYRTARLGTLLEVQLEQNDIPYNVIGGLRLRDRAEIKDLLALPQAILNPSNDIATLRAIKIFCKGIGEKTLISICTSEDRGFLDAIINLKTRPNIKISKKRKEQLEHFANVSKYLIEQIDKKDTPEFLADLYSDNNFEDWLKKKYPDDYTTRKDRINAFLDSLESTTMSLQEVVDILSLEMSGDQCDTDSDMLTLSSIHSAKGLEWDTVFVIGLEHGVFPSERRDFNNNDMQEEEERRLFYVAITRAKSNLEITCCRRRKSRQWEGLMGPSKFVYELNIIPKEIVSKQICSPRHLQFLKDVGVKL